ncbi:hypothetical protein L486_07083 [Kwoniella mangroviensis CBS 10435]|uniref:SET domain-containing protein n=1 Tax=Kwoniella mangroviensis CBS 10435 TaxID=1331196 RepID=A0A1B9IIV2_9TREE|nr:hypothetical protein L486_07083 [Kwoniella mangroviensis CBS 10435]
MNTDRDDIPTESGDRGPSNSETRSNDDDVKGYSLDDDIQQHELFQYNETSDLSSKNKSIEVSSQCQNEIAQPHPINPLNLHLVSHPSRGRGVFAPTIIPAGTLIEESPVLVIAQREWEEGKMNDSVLGSYGFCWRDGGMGIGLGLASLFNHSSSPNVNFIRQFSNSTIKFITTKKIEKGEELCICYSADESKLWFVKSDQAVNPTNSQDEMVSSEEEEEEGMEGFFSKIDLDEEDLVNEDGIAQKKERERSTSTPASATSSRTSTPSSSSIYPEASSGIITSLPPPLHSTKTDPKSIDGRYMELTDELDWDEEYWTDTAPYPTGEGREDEFAEFIRIKGPAEREDEVDQDGTMEIWTLEFTDPRLTRTALDFSKELTATDERLRHLKRVCRRKENDQEICRIVLAMVTEYEQSTLQTIMASYSPTLSHLTPAVHIVPSSIARTQEQMKVKSHIWPVSFQPTPVIPIDSWDWPIGRKAWVTSGIKRVLSLALEAKSKGELPIAAYCTAQPSHFWPKKEEGFIPPTEGLRASSNDTRVSDNHPLRHSALNCIKFIAYLRTIPPFTEITPTRNGADYLLTSLSLFITHEPCVMCCMALLHSRVKEVFYVFDRSHGGGFSGSGLGINARNDLNHKFHAWKYDGTVDERTKELLKFDEDIQV